jgi:hypothetical protein
MTGRISQLTVYGNFGAFAGSILAIGLSASRLEIRSSIHYFKFDINN